MRYKRISSISLCPYLECRSLALALCHPYTEMENPAVAHVKKHQI